MHSLPQSGQQGQTQTTTDQRRTAERYADELRHTNEGRYWAKRAETLRDQEQRTGGTR